MSLVFPFGEWCVFDVWTIDGAAFGDGVDWQSNKQTEYRWVGALTFSKAIPPQTERRHENDPQLSNANKKIFIDKHKLILYYNRNNNWGRKLEFGFIWCVCLCVFRFRWFYYYLIVIRDLPLPEKCAIVCARDDRTYSTHSWLTFLIVFVFVVSRQFFFLLFPSFCRLD